MRDEKSFRSDVDRVLSDESVYGNLGSKIGIARRKDEVHCNN